MKAVSQTLWIVITIVVIIVAALVVITVFSTGITQVTSLSEAESICSQWCASSCAAIGSEPINWNAKTIKVGDTMKSCSDSDVYGPCSCT